MYFTIRMVFHSSTQSVNPTFLTAFAGRRLRKLVILKHKDNVLFFFIIRVWNMKRIGEMKQKKYNFFVDHLM